MRQRRVPTVTYRTASDKLLLAIIDGSFGVPREPKKFAEREKRLLQARKTLMGVEPSVGRKHIYDERALSWLARQILRVRSASFSKKNIEPPKGSKSLLFEDLLKAAAEQSYGNSSNSTVARLRKKFKKNEQMLLDVARYSDDIEDSHEITVLEQVQTALTRINIDLDLTMVRARR